MYQTKQSLVNIHKYIQKCPSWHLAQEFTNSFQYYTNAKINERQKENVMKKDFNLFLSCTISNSMCICVYMCACVCVLQQSYE